MKLDPDRCAAAGMSAFGALALALAATEPADGVEGTGNLEVSSRVKGAVNYFGPCGPPSWRIADRYNRDPAVLQTVKVYDFGRTPKDANDALNLLLEANYGVLPEF